MGSTTTRDYLDRPTCPYCGNPTGISGSRYGLQEPSRLKCAECGRFFDATTEQVEQARLADLAWDNRTDERRGPLEAVVRTRRKTSKAHRMQVPIDWTSKTTA